MQKFFLFAALAMLTAHGKSAPFVNLDFEMVNTNTGWRLFLGTFELPAMSVNVDCFELGCATLVDREGLPSFRDFFPSGSFPSGFAGNYGVALTVDRRPMTFTQRGDVPADARQLQVNAFTSAGTTLEVRLNGELVYQQRGDSAQLPLRYGVAAFAGQTVDLELKFLLERLSAFSYPHIGLDSVQFSSEPLLVENDFNGDGTADVVFQHEDGFIGVWFMNAGPDLISASFFNPIGVADPRWRIVGTGDFNGDLKTDLLFQDEDGTLGVWFMDGTNLVSATLLNPSQPGAGWKVVATAHLGLDGKKDIIFQHTDGTLAVWLMDGVNLVQATLFNPSCPSDSRWRVVGTADHSDYGGVDHFDLIFQDADGVLGAWYMSNTTLNAAVLLDPPVPSEAGWRVAGALYLNPDDRSDLLFQHDDGTVAVWLMNGFNLISGQFLNPSNPGSGWRIVGPK